MNYTEKRQKAIEEMGEKYVLHPKNKVSKESYKNSPQYIRLQKAMSKAQNG